MSIEEAVREIEERIRATEYVESSYVDCVDIEALRIVIKAPKQSEQRWIPCSERLPKKDDYKSCIECLDGAVWYFTENGTMGFGYYYKSTKEWSTTGGLKTDGKVVAWMPLPEPFGGEGETDE